MEETKTLEVKVEQKLGLLNWNFDELNVELDSQLEKYRGLTFTDDQMPEAKKTRAALNKVATEINNRKLAVKKEFCAPYDQFEAQAKILIGKIKEVSGAIDQQVKEFEEAKKEEKRQRIKEWWSEHGKQNVPIEKIWDDRWLNTTCSDAKWQSDLEAAKEKITNQLSALSQMGDPNHPEKTEFLFVEYMKTLSLEQAVSAWTVHEEALNRANAERERMEQERLRREAERNETATKAEPQPAPVQEHQTLSEEDYLYTRTFTCTDMTYQQIWDLNNFMKEKKISFSVDPLKKYQRRK